MSEEITHKLESILAAGMEAMALEMGLAGLPETIRGANPELFCGFTMEVCSFVIYYAAAYENAEKGVELSRVRKEWSVLTGSTLGRKPLEQVISKYFNRYVLCKDKARHRMLEINGRNVIGARAAKKRLLPKQLPIK